MSIRAEIDRARRTVAAMEREGRAQDRDLAESYLRGLLAADAIYAGTAVTEGCAHLIHTSCGLDDDARTIWACRDCGERAEV